MKKIITLFVVFFALSAVAQKDEVLFTVNNEPVMVSEFKSVYEKNLDLVDGEEKDIDKNLDLFINYKLKVKQAYDLKLDTAKSYLREYKSYKNQLIAPYLQDKELQEKLVKQAYDRTKEEVRASHILIMYPPKGQPRDTVAMYNKLMDARKKIENGEPFEKLAREISDDKSVKVNGGDLGYFSAFRMVYPFEDNAYKTKIGKVSKPFTTRFGYHIVKVTDKRKSKGDFEVAHILAVDKSIVGKVKIDSAYQALQNGKLFEEVAKKYSQDRGTSNSGGKLPKFSTGSMVKQFENAVLGLKKEGDFSKPFKTKYGWHIVKLLKNYPVPPFEDLKPELTRKVRSGERGRLSHKAVLGKLKNQYKISEDRKIIRMIRKNRSHITEQKYKKEVLTINERKIPTKEFLKYIKYRKNQSVKELFEGFKNQQIINYFKDNLENTNVEFKQTLQEYRDGLLLFELLQQKIWNKSVTDTVGVQNYYTKNTSKYNNKPYKEVKGLVMSDYQKYLEDNWIAELRKNNAVRVRKRALKKLKKQYNQ